MPRIFISYRRRDRRTFTGRLHDQLALKYGSNAVFMDVHDIPPAADFEAHLRERINWCDVMLVIIGPEWLNILQQRSLSDEDDWVCREVAAGLDRREQSRLRIIPVLVDGAVMPDKQHLPETLHRLVPINALPIREDPDFRGDMERLVGVIGHRFSRRWLLTGLLLALLAAAVALVVMRLYRPARHIPDEMVDLARLVPENPDPAYDEALRLYQDGDYRGASAALLLLGKPKQTVAGLREQAEVAFLKANTLLLMLDYDAAENAFSAVLSYSDQLPDEYLRPEALHNRGVARMHRARAEDFSQDDFHALVEAAVSDFSAVIDNPNTDVNLTALAYVNRGMIGIFFRFTPPVARDSLVKPAEDCNQPAVHNTSPSIRAMGISCMAAIETFRLTDAWSQSRDQDAYCSSLDVSATLRELDSAIRIAPQLAAPHLLYGMLRLREYDCDRRDNQKRDDAAAHFERYLDLMAAQTAILALNWDWVKDTACGALRTYAVRSHSLCPSG